MPDDRSRVEKLRAMARDESSPHEAAIARERLKAMGVPVIPPPPKRPTRNAAGPFPDDDLSSGEARWHSTNPVDWTVTVETSSSGSTGWTRIVTREGPFVDD